MTRIPLDKRWGIKEYRKHFVKEFDLSSADGNHQGTPYAITDYGRITRGVMFPNNDAATGKPRMYPLTVTLRAADKAKTLDRIDITDQSTSNTS